MFDPHAPEVREAFLEGIKQRRNHFRDGVVRGLLWGILSMVVILNLVV